MHPEKGVAPSSAEDWLRSSPPPCLGPLVLVALGSSGAWIGNLTVLEPYRPICIGAALMALFFAWRRVSRPALLR